MNTHDSNKPKSIIDSIEETFIVFLLGAMVLITFSQVVARYIFNTGWGSALELTQVLFAWLILFGMSYGIKIGSHLGVDILVRKFSPSVFKFFAIFGGVACIAYGVLFFSSDWIDLIGGPDKKGGAYFYWEKIKKIGIGMESIVLPEFIFGPDERLPRWIAYLMLPVGLALFVFRCIQATIAIVKGDREMIIAAHEAEELLEENRGILGD